MHVWGDDWFKKNGEDLEAAVTFIGTMCRKWGRIGGQFKEKWGTVRFYAVPHHQIHDLIWPDYCRIIWPNWLHRLDLAISFSRWYCRLIKPLIHRHQEWIYRNTYLQALALWPHLRAEILSDADWKELFPIDIQREANKTWFRSANPGDLVYVYHSNYTLERAVIDASDNKKLWLQAPNGLVYRASKTLYRHWDGCGIS